MRFTEWVKKLFGGRQLAKWTAGMFGFGETQSYLVDNVFQSDFVNNAIERIASEIGKIEVRSVVEKNDSVIVQNDDLSRLFRFGPNPLQTTADFLSSIAWIRLKCGNVFLLPRYDLVKDAYGREVKKFNAFFVLQPFDFEVGVNDDEVWEIKFFYPDGGYYILPYNELIHLKWRRGTNLFKGGGDDNGQMQNKDLLKTVNALNQTIEGLPKAIAASMQVKGVYSATSAVELAKQKAMRDNIEDHIFSSKAGIITTDVVGEFTPINMQIPVISEGNMNFIKSGINQRFGVSEAILNGDYTGSQHSSFYQTAIEGFIVDAEQAFSRNCFSQREQDIGHRLKFYFSKIKYWNTSDQLEMSRQARDTGIMTQNQVLEMFGLPPYEGGNLRLRSLNYVNADIADEYQMMRAKGGEGFEPQKDQKLDVSGKAEQQEEKNDGTDNDENGAGDG